MDSKVIDLCSILGLEAQFMAGRFLDDVGEALFGTLYQKRECEFSSGGGVFELEIDTSIKEEEETKEIEKLPVASAIEQNSANGSHGREVIKTRPWHNIESQEVQETGRETNLYCGVNVGEEENKESESDGHTLNLKSESDGQAHDLKSESDGQMQDLKSESEHERDLDKLEEGQNIDKPRVWIKFPSPKRLQNGFQTKYYFLPEGNFESGPPYKCFCCNHESLNLSDIKTHFHKVHMKVYKCIECDMRKKTWTHVVTHWNRVHNPNRQEQLKFVCETCGKKYEQKSELRIHSLVHSEPRFPCKYCGKMFKSPYSQKAHEGVHERELKACTVCGKILSCNSALALHVRNVHFDQEKVDCNLCEKKLKNKIGLELHMKIIHEKVDKKYDCHLCSTMFRKAGQLKDHIETVHEKSQLFPCPYCNTVLSSRKRFKLHSKRLHNGRELPEEIKEQIIKQRQKAFRVNAMS